MNKTWNELLAFESRDLVGRYIMEKYNRELNRERTLQIISNFIQGREYYRSSEDANPTVRPLLQYYGVMALSKGLILSTDLNKTEAQLKGSHGLEINNWNQVIKSKEFENLEIVVRDGTFFELITTTENRNYLRANSSVVNYWSHLRMPQKGDSLLLKQLISYYPDLNKEYESWIREKLHFAILNSLKIDNETNLLNIELQGNIEQNIIDQLFPREFCKDLNVNQDNGKTKVSYTVDNWTPNITQRWHGAFNIGDACIIPTIKNDIGLNLISGLYMISYVFGMMARYFPTTWIGIMRGEKGDKIFPFVHRIMDFIDEKFPLIILDFLNSPYDFEKE
jgi:hypothetical protein